MVRTAGWHLLLGGILRFTTPSCPGALEPATWLSGDAHDRTCTGKQTMVFRAHRREVSWTSLFPEILPRTGRPVQVILRNLKDALIQE
jgi:hypothetical protein